MIIDADFASECNAELWHNRRTDSHKQRSEDQQRLVANAISEAAGGDVQHQARQREGGAREAHPRRASAEALCVAVQAA